MATVLQPIVNELNTVLAQLRTELRGLQTDADGAGIAIVRTGRKRAAGDTTQPAIPLARITIGWACQISIVPLFQTIAVRTKVPDHGELLSARRWSGKVGRLKSAVPGRHLRKRAIEPPSYLVRRLG